VEVSIELSTFGFDNGEKITLLIKDKNNSKETLNSVEITLTENKAKDEKLKIKGEWQDKSLVIAVDNGISEPYESSKALEIGLQFCDPLSSMKIRKNRASNLFGKVRSQTDDKGKTTINAKNHQGFDYYAISGTEIKAVSDGIIKKMKMVNSFFEVL
jgi:murein DD-endopeptidase MepM/ murein hydrolase activator NlpD